MVLSIFGIQKRVFWFKNLGLVWVQSMPRNGVIGRVFWRVVVSHCVGMVVG